MNNDGKRNHAVGKFNTNKLGERCHLFAHIETFLEQFDYFLTFKSTIVPFASALAGAIQSTIIPPVRGK